MLISPGYVALLRDLHAAPRGFGASGKKHADTVLSYAVHSGSLSILDYGCGQGKLSEELRALGWGAELREYDPAIPGRDAPPHPADIVTCTDVLEHVEPDTLDAVLVHIRSLTLRAAYFVVSTQPAHKVLGDGRNAHLIVESAAWWATRILKAHWRILMASSRWNSEGHADYTVWVTPERARR